jgi:hypothetical protein
MLANHPPGICIPLVSITSKRKRKKRDGRKGRPTNNTRNPAEDREEDVDQEVGIAASLEEDRERWQEDGEEVETHVRLDGMLAVLC